MRRLTFLVLLLLGSLSAVPATAAISEAGAYFIVSPRSFHHHEQLTFRYNEGLGWRSARPRTFAPKGRLYDYRILPFGNLRVEAVLRRNEVIVARARITVPIEGDRYYDVHAELRTDDPTRGCIGCGKAISTLIPDRAGERLWLWYGFNGISHPIVF